MKLVYSILCVAFFLVACETKKDNNAADDAFAKNSKSVMAYLEGFQNESVEYDSLFAPDFIMRDTGFGSKDSLSLAEIKTGDIRLWENYDFKIVTDSLSLLPGVNADTKLADGSVRYYADWKVTRTATDSTQAKSGVLSMYESFDFDENGKILYQQAYADFSGLFRYLHSNDSIQ